MQICFLELRLIVGQSVAGHMPRSVDSVIIVHHLMKTSTSIMQAESLILRRWEEKKEIELGKTRRSRNHEQ